YTFYALFLTSTAPTQIYTLSLHDALPISRCWSAPTPTATGSPAPACASPTCTARGWRRRTASSLASCARPGTARASRCAATGPRSEEHTSELQSRGHLVCRLLLEKKNTSN